VVSLALVAYNYGLLVLRSDHFFLQVFSKINRFSWPVNYATKVDQGDVNLLLQISGTILRQLFLGCVSSFSPCLWFRSSADSQIYRC